MTSSQQGHRQPWDITSIYYGQPDVTPLAVTPLAVTPRDVTPLDVTTPDVLQYHGQHWVKAVKPPDCSAAPLLCPNFANNPISNHFPFKPVISWKYLLHANPSP